MSRFSISIEQARAFAKKAAHFRRKWGRQASPPYTLEQIMEVFELLDAQGCFEQEQTTRDDVIKLRRQLGAAKSRFARLLKRLHEAGITDSESPEGDTADDA